MESCGNRVKARRHYQQQQQGTNMKRHRNPICREVGEELGVSLELEGDRTKSSSYLELLPNRRIFFGDWLQYGLSTVVFDMRWWVSARDSSGSIVLFHG